LAAPEGAAPANGGYGGGGGGGYAFSNGGGSGGGGGYSGGGGGYGAEGYVGGGGGGGSFLSPLVSDGEKTSRVNPGDGFIDIELLTPAPVPEPSTWAMALTGFAGLGLLARLRSGKKAFGRGQ
jgi:hypothetical protein